jgi:predicted metal-dependent peptidase
MLADSEDGRKLVAACEKKLSYMTTYMAIHDRFNYEIFARMSKVADASVGSAGVSSDKDSIRFLYNPRYIGGLTTQQLAYVVSHEVGHVVLHHFDKQRPKEARLSKLHDIAADLAVNTLFKPLDGIKDVPPAHVPLLGPDGAELIRVGSPAALVPARFGLPELQSLEKYYQMLMDMYPEQGGGQSGEDEDQQGNNGQGESQPDGGESGDGEEYPAPSMENSHGQWEKDGVAEALAREWVEGMQGQESWGSLKGYQKAAVSSAQKASVPWDALLRQKLGDMSSTTKVSTYKRPSRRFGYPWCSKMIEPRDRKLVAIDTSGSVSDRDLSRFKTEIDRLSEEQLVDYITFDAHIHQESPMQWVPGRTFEFQGRGGTEVGPVLEMARKHGYQDCIILTDGYFDAPHPADASGLEVLWVITKGGVTRPAEFGAFVQVD